MIYLLSAITLFGLMLYAFHLGRRYEETRRLEIIVDRYNSRLDGGRK